jgi:septum formation protein
MQAWQAWEPGQAQGSSSSVAKAIAQLLKMQGKHHELVTAVCLMMPHKKICFENRTRLYMRQLTEESVREYVQLDSPLDCAGSYKLESRGIKLFEKIEMDDHTSIIGLPLIQLNNHLLELGYPL